MALPGFPELMLVTAELFHRSAVAADLSTRLSPATVRYEGLFGLSIDGYGAKARFLSLDDTVVAYTGGGPAWQYALIGAFFALVASCAAADRLRARTVVAVIADLPGALISAIVLVAGAFAVILPGWGVREGPGSRWRRWGSPS